MVGYDSCSRSFASSIVDVAEYAKIGSLAQVQKEPEPFVEYIDGSDSVGLSDAEILHFKREGFIVKRGLIRDRKALASVVDYVWDTVPTNVLNRFDSSTWLDEPSKRWPLSRSDEIGVLHGTNWKMRSKYRIGQERLLLDVSANNHRVRQVVKAFLGPSIADSLRVRGVYVVLPKPLGREGKLGPHVDHAASQLCAMVLVDDIKPRMGGFTVWPRSHIRLHPYWQTRFGAQFEPSLKEQFDSEFKAILADTVPVEFVGKAGDVVFWHPRLIHSAGVNYSAESGEPLIRYVIPCDFQQAGFTFFDDDDLGPGKTHQWWVDTRNYREDLKPLPENLWHQWLI